ncbi:anti-sigma factor [Marinomonas dokdonensis]|uniref:anti-sigma factor n=1 Tax=Marinomonas dokdonensis TaxID=328224 RepID=UPI00405539A1
MNQYTDETPETDNTLAGQYVLGTLSADERSAFETRLARSTELQSKVNKWQAHFASITDRLEPMPAPQPLSVRIERSLDALESSAQTNKSAPTKQTSFWQSLALWRGLSLAGFAFAVFFAVQLQFVTPKMSDPTYIAVLVAPENKTPGWVIQTSQATQIQLVPLAAVEIPEGKVLQFWTKADGWEAPISLGLVEKGQTLNIALDQLPPLTENQLFELTLEQEGGSPTGKPTGPIQSIGRGSIML